MAGKRTYVEKIGRLIILGAMTCALVGCVQPKPITAAPTDHDNSVIRTEDQAPAPSQIAPDDDLKDSDCTKCHDSQPTDVQQNGGKHKTAVACLDCHLEHLPLGKETIPQCSMCHDSSDQKHFALGEREVCLGCHRNPHTPLDVTVDDVPENSIGCKTCHASKGDEFSQYPSKHAQKNCTFCHPTKHKVINKCLTCHEAHAEFMVYEDCLRCHQPHSPLNIKYADDTPSKYCGSCHTDLFEMLTKSKAKHSALNCAYCHKTQHPTVPNCADCHGSPHDNTILNPFNSDCLKCHRNPHDLIF